MTSEIEGKVYLITNKINGKKYVGQTIRPIAQRFREHCRADSVIGCAIRKYGEFNFTIEHIDTAFSLEELNALEQFWIKEHDSYNNGYNLTIGGGSGTVGYRHTEDARKKMSESHTGKTITARQRECLDENRVRINAEQSRPVDMLDKKTGEFLKTFKSINDADMFIQANGQLNKGIGRVLKGQRNICCGYRWRDTQGGGANESSKIANP